MKKLFFMSLIALSLFMISCEEQLVLNASDQLPLDKEVKIAYNQVLTNADENISIKFIKVTNDSRCPTKVECVWIGDAEVHFILTNGKKEIPVLLHTTLEPKGTKADNFYVELVKLDPYPDEPGEIPQDQYVATIKVSKN